MDTFMILNSVQRPFTCETCQLKPQQATGYSCCACMLGYWQCLLDRASGFNMSRKDPRLALRNFILRTVVDVFVKDNYVAAAGGMVFDGVHDPCADIRDIDLFTVYGCGQTRDTLLTNMCTLIGGHVMYSLQGTCRCYHVKNSPRIVYSPYTQQGSETTGHPMCRWLSKWSTISEDDMNSICQQISTLERMWMQDDASAFSTRQINTVDKAKILCRGFLSETDIDIDIVWLHMPEVSKVFRVLRATEEVEKELGVSTGHSRTLLKLAQYRMACRIVSHFDMRAVSLFVHTDHGGPGHDPSTTVCSDDPACIDDAHERKIVLRKGFLKATRPGFVVVRPSRIIKYLQKGCTLDCASACNDLQAICHSGQLIIID